GQCNCPYWHGAFGGIYLPHLRNAIYEQLITADELLEKAQGRPEHWVQATAEDFNFDGRPEIRLANDRMVAYLAPHQGGILYEWDCRPVRRNLLATMTRRPELYHEKVRAGASPEHQGCASIHDRVVFKQAGLESRLQYDIYPRKSLVDLVLSPETTLEQAASGQIMPWAKLWEQPYEGTIHTNPDRVRATLTTEADVLDQRIRVTKAVLLSAGSSILEVAYRLENLPPDRPFLFAVEFNFAGLPAEADDRFFLSLAEEKLGHLGTRLDLGQVSGLALVDQWLGLRVQVGFSRPTDVWTFPVASVSQSEGGFELVHQSVAVQPHWLVQPDAEGRWTVSMRFLLVAESQPQTSTPEAVLSATA
ncbi:MAG: DUF1926 domain-containing protein, partial [Thermogutta sp.]|uniref:alpha-amylase/4-alpha-glucanotransferase domain-containing protein n=1 Tax=Thermogutta sp. TaxID=1962930 RepID=UPI0019C97F3D